MQEIFLHTSDTMLYYATGGAAGSVARITGSVGSTLAALSFDQDYTRVNRSIFILLGQNEIPVCVCFRFPNPILVFALPINILLNKLKKQKNCQIY